MSGNVARAVITGDGILVAEHEELVGGPDRGAVVGFGGIVRNHDHGRMVTALEYMSHPSAEDIISQVATDAASRVGVSEVAISHRIGNLTVGDVALACAVSAAHRQAAFDACAWLVDEAKRRLPIWKHQVFDDGTDEWVNCP